LNNGGSGGGGAVSVGPDSVSDLESWDAEAWAQAKDIVAAVLERPEAERAALLDVVCTDPRLRAKIASLLQNYTTNFLTDVVTGSLSFGAGDTQPLFDEPLRPGAMVGHYTIIEQLGVGGMGRVYLANDTILKRRVALKCLLSSNADGSYNRERIAAEAQAAARIHHANVASVHRIVEDGERVYIDMEYIEGESLADSIARGPLMADRVVAIGRELAAGLGAAHAEGFVHRDLKPANVRVMRDGHVKILDFGIAQAFAVGTPRDTADATTRRVVPANAGTPAYMSPEQVFARRVDSRSDLYSLGVVLFELATGRRPYPADNPFALVSALNAPRLRADRVSPTVPRALADVIAKALAFDADERYQTSAEVDAALVKVELALASRRKTRLRRLWLGGAAAALALTAAGVLVGVFVRAPNSAVTIIVRPVIAVLPLENLVGDSSKTYLGAGVADTLVMALSRVRQLIVISGAEVQEAVKGGRDPRRLAKAMGTSMLVDGSVQQEGDRLRMTLRILAPDGSVVWGETFEGTSASIFRLQQTMAAALVRAVQSRAGIGPQNDFTIPATTNPDALTTYWRGRAQLDASASPAQIEEAIATFKEVVAFDPTYSLGYAGLADAYWKQYEESHDEAFARSALEAGLQAVHLDPGQPAVRVSVATIYRGLGQLDEAIDALQAALAAQPNNSDAHRVLAEVYRSRGRWDDAIAEYKEAISLRPTFLRTYLELSNVYRLRSRLKDAEEILKQAIDVNPNDSRAYVNLGAIYADIPDNERALEYFIRGNQIQPQRRAFNAIGTIYYRLGRYEEAVSAYLEALKLDPKSDLYHSNLGDVYRKLKRVEDARREYGTAYELSLSALRVNQQDAPTLGRAALYAAKLGKRDEALSRIRQAQAAAKGDVNIQFTRVRIEALVGSQAQALTELQRALEMGYSKRNAAEEDDLASLKQSPQFQALVNKR
jgi:tetratricopeptide (TPR) repeat protein/tRNA A-37 threonylcarbamoyl transferase component Bud32